MNTKTVSSWPLQLVRDPLCLVNSEYFRWNSLYDPQTVPFRGRHEWRWLFSRDSCACHPHRWSRMWETEKNITGAYLEMMMRYWIPIPFNIISQALLSHSWKNHERSLNICSISWRAYPSNGSKTLISQVPSCNSVITSRIFSYEKIVR